MKAAHQHIIDFARNATDDRILIYKKGNTDLLEGVLYDGGGAQTTITTANDVPDSGDVWIYAENDATNFRIGFSTSKVNSWNDINANDKASGNDHKFTASATGGLTFGDRYAAAFSYPMSAKVYYLLIAKKKIITH